MIQVSRSFSGLGAAGFGPTGGTGGGSTTAPTTPDEPTVIDGGAGRPAQRFVIGTIKNGISSGLESVHWSCVNGSKVCVDTRGQVRDDSVCARAGYLSATEHDACEPPAGLGAKFAALSTPAKIGIGAGILGILAVVVGSR